MYIPTHIDRVYLKNDFLFWCYFSAFNKNFLSALFLIRVKWFLLILPRSWFTPNSYEKLLQDFFFSVFYLFVLSVCYLFFKFPLPVFVFEISSFTICVSESQFLTNESFSGLLYIRFDKIYPWVIISLNLHYCVSLYTIFIIPLCSCKFLRYYVSNLISWKIVVNDLIKLLKLLFLIF